MVAVDQLFGNTLFIRFTEHVGAIFPFGFEGGFNHITYLFYINTNIVNDINAIY